MLHLLSMLRGKQKLWQTETHAYVAFDVYRGTVDVDYDAVKDSHDKLICIAFELFIINLRFRKIRKLKISN